MGAGKLEIQYDFDLGGGTVNIEKGTFEVDTANGSTYEEIDLNVNIHIADDAEFIISDVEYGSSLKNVTINNLTGGGNFRFGKGSINENDTINGITLHVNVTDGEFSGTIGNAVTSTKNILDVNSGTLKLTNSSPFNNENGAVAVNISTDAALALDRSEIEEDSYTFEQKRTGNGTLQGTQNAKTDKFSFGNNVGNGFEGIFELAKGTIEFEGKPNNNNANALTNATLKLNGDSTAAVKSNSTIGNLTTNGGTVKFTTNEILPAQKQLTVTNLDLSGGVTIDIGDPDSTSKINTAAGGNQNIFDFANDNNNSYLLIEATETIQGDDENITLITESNNELLQQLYGLKNDAARQEQFEQILFQQLGPELAADAVQLGLSRPYVQVFNHVRETGGVSNISAGIALHGQNRPEPRYELWLEGYYRSEKKLPVTPLPAVTKTVGEVCSPVSNPDWGNV
jgi:hypothetical protein